MNAGVSSINTLPVVSSRAWTIALWVAQLGVAGILGMMAFMKFFNYTPEGSMALATALGALFSHATIIGFSGSPVAEMWVMALVVLAASTFVLVSRRKELPVIGSLL
jgi:hypothetical protein